MKTYAVPSSKDVHPSAYIGDIEILRGNKKYLQDPMRRSENREFTIKRSESEGVKMVTDRLMFIPIDNSPETIDFCHTRLFGNANVMAGYAEGSIQKRDEVAARVSDLSSRWEKGNFYSGFIVLDVDTNEKVAFTSLEQSRVSAEFTFEVLVVDTLADGSSAYNRKIGTEITATMFEGWAVFLNEHPEIRGPKSSEITFITAQVAKSNYAHRIFTRMLEGSKTNSDKSFETSRRGQLETRFYTTPNEMNLRRKDILLEEEFDSTRNFAISLAKHHKEMERIEMERLATGFGLMLPFSPGEVRSASPDPADLSLPALSPIRLEFPEFELQADFSLGDMSFGNERLSLPFPTSGDANQLFATPEKETEKEAESS